MKTTELHFDTSTLPHADSLDMGVAVAIEQNLGDGQDVDSTLRYMSPGFPSENSEEKSTRSVLGFRGDRVRAAKGDPLFLAGQPDYVVTQFLNGRLEVQFGDTVPQEAVTPQAITETVYQLVAEMLRRKPNK